MSVYYSILTRKEPLQNVYGSWPRWLTCKLCMETFKFQLAREFHFDVIHNFCMYMCKYCENSEDQEQKGITYSYFELLDHIYSFHGKNPYTVLNYLNIF